MGDRKDLQSNLKRAKFGVLPWIELLPKDAQMDAGMALDKLMEVAEREIEQAYFDGHNNRSQSERARQYQQLKQER